MTVFETHLSNERLCKVDDRQSEVGAHVVYLSWLPLVEDLVKRLDGIAHVEEVSCNASVAVDVTAMTV